MMQADARLAGLEYLERQLALLLPEAARRTKDPDVAEQLFIFGERHTARADEIAGAVGGTAELKTPREISAEVDDLWRELQHARTQDGVLVALLDAARTEDAEYREALRQPYPDDVAEMLRRQQIQERDAFIYLEETAPHIAPDIGGPRDVAPPSERS